MHCNKRDLSKIICDNFYILKKKNQCKQWTFFNNDNLYEFSNLNFIYYGFNV